MSILQPATLLSALVNEASPTRGMRTVNYDTGTGNATGYGVISTAATAGSNANIGTALFLEVTTAYGIEIVRVKSISGNASSGTLVLAENGIVWGNNFPIVIKHFFQISGIPPAIRSQVFYKDFDISFSSAFATQANPVANVGQHFAGFLSGGSLALSLNAGGSYAVASGASISSYAWACVHNGGGTTGISFSSTTSATPTLTITAADTYWLSLTITDSNGRKQTTYRCIFVYDPAGTPPYTDFTISSLNGDWNSGQWRCSLNLTGTLTRTVVPDGSLAVVWMQNYFDGTEGYINLWSPYGNNIVYTGYIWSDNDQDDWDAGTGQASFEIISPVAYLDAITDYGTVSLEAKTSPALWSDYASTLTVGRGVHHLLKWDTTILDCVDVYGLTANAYGVKVLEFTEDTLLQRINGVAYQRGIHAKMVSDRLGRLHLVQDSQMLNTAARTALDTIFTIINGDISGGPNIPRDGHKVRAFADMDGFTYSHPTSTPFISMIPGYIESTISYNLPEFRGTGAATSKQQVFSASGGQTDCNERAGRLLALENVTPREVRFDCRGNYIGAFDIVPNQGWYSWGVSDSALKRQLPLNGTKMVCRSVTHQQVMGDNAYGGLLQTVDVALQPEAIGPDGIPGNYPTSYPAKKTVAPEWESGTIATDTTALLAYLDLTDSSRVKAAVAELGSITVGTIVNIDSSATSPACCGLSSAKGLVAYVSGGNAKIKVVNVSGTTISSVGAAQTIASTTIHQIIGLSATLAVAVGVDGGGACLIAMTISGDTITPGTAVNISMDDSLGLGIARLTATSVVVAGITAGGGPARALIATISGTTVTAGTLVDVGSSDNIFAAVGVFDSATGLITYVVDSTRDLKAVSIYGVTGTTFTTGSTITLHSADGVERSAKPSVVNLSSTKALVGYRAPDTLPAIRAIVVTYGGTGSISSGTSVSLSSGSDNRHGPALAPLSDSQVMLAYQFGSATLDTYLRSVTVAGSAITDQSNQTFVDGDADFGSEGAIAMGVLDTI